MKTNVCCSQESVERAAVAAAPKLPYTLYTTGTPAGAFAGPFEGPVLDLGGGNWDVDAAFQSIIDQVRGCTGTCARKINIVVLRSTGADGYNSYLYAFEGVQSVRTFVIASTTGANHADVDAAIRGSAIVFFAGGNQCDYVKYFKGTKVETATKAVYAAGGAVGGTSAGEAILGTHVFDSCGGTIDSAMALSDPYDRKITFTYGFFNFAANGLSNTMTEQHFSARDRMGRLLSFLARQIKDGKTSSILGIAVNEETSLVVDRLSVGRVVRNDGVTVYTNASYTDPLPPASTAPFVYFILANHAPEVCVSRQPLTYIGYKVWKRGFGETFNLAALPATPDYTLDVVDGVITANGNGGSIY